VFPEESDHFSDNHFYVERLVKFLLWQRGAARLSIGGPVVIGEHIRAIYSREGARQFDFEFMSNVFETPLQVDCLRADEVPDTDEPTVSLGRHLEGSRIGFDLGASDYKISAVVDGEPVYADEFPWQPRDQEDPVYHYSHINEGLRRAAEHLPRVDAIGGSAAGVWIDDQVRVASLFRGVPQGVFDSTVKDMFVRIRDEWGVPLNIVNDGEVTALAGSMSLESNGVLGIAMGSSEAAGYVTPDGNITRWLNELAFAPIDLQANAPFDEWLLTPAEKLKVIQDLMSQGDERIPPIFQTIGVWLGYALAHYADFYDIHHVLILGRVTSGEGGRIILEEAQRVLVREFPLLANRVELHVPDEKTRRVGQSVAAASLPVMERRTPS
jgi:predicted NBD/HSP70 family sugar kinase